MGKRTYLADPKPKRRVKDLGARVAALRAEPECVLCGEPVTGPHHILFRSQGGDDVPANLVGLCGSATTGCHGLVHAAQITTLMLLGDYLVESRPDFCAYLVDKLAQHGPQAARAWMQKRLRTVLPPMV